MGMNNLWRHWQLRQCTDPAVKEALSNPWPSPKNNWKQTPWLAIDLEMTSLNATEGEIVSLGWVAIDRGTIQINSMQRWLVKPENTVGESATIHYLRDEDLDTATGLHQALVALATAMSGRACVFHNKQLDTEFLHQAFVHHFNIPWNWPTADTLKLEWRRLERKGEHLKRDQLRLSECRKRYHLPDYPLHDASHDALACAELLLAWASHSGGEGPRLKECLAWSK